MRREESLSGWKDGAAAAEVLLPRPLSLTEFNLPAEEEEEKRHFNGQRSGGGERVCLQEQGKK